MYPDNITLFYLKSVSMQEHFVFLGDVYIQPQLSKMDFLSSNCKLVYQVARKQFFFLIDVIRSFLNIKISIG